MTRLTWNHLLCSLVVLSGVAVSAAPAVAGVEGVASDLPSPEGPVVLTIEGNIARTNAEDRALFDLAMIEALPVTTLDTSTVVTDGVGHFEGVLMHKLLEFVGAEGELVTATAVNDYVIDIPMSDFVEFDVLAAYRMDGDQLTARDKGPLWIVYPRDDHDELQDIRYDYRWVWQLVRLEVHAQ